MIGTVPGRRCLHGAQRRGGRSRPEQFTASRLPIPCQILAKPLPVAFQSPSNRLPIACQSAFDPLPVAFQSPAHRLSIACQSPVNRLLIPCQSPANRLPIACQSPARKPLMNKDRMPDMCLSAQSGLSSARWRCPCRRPLRASPRDPVMLAPTPRAGWTALRARAGCFNARPARRLGSDRAAKKKGSNAPTRRCSRLSKLIRQGAASSTGQLRDEQAPARAGAGLPAVIMAKSRSSDQSSLWLRYGSFWRPLKK